jgi:hypothetical protein
MEMVDQTEKLDGWPRAEASRLGVPVLPRRKWVLRIQTDQVT